LDPGEERPKTLPDVGAVLAGVFARVAEEQRPLLLAIAERLAAERYRGWASERELLAHREPLLECAAREERIAERAEALFPDAAVAQREILAKSPDLAEINRSLFAGWPLADQLTIQARGERLGAAAWRAFAAASRDAEARDVLLGCADLEEANARALESMLLAAGPLAYRLRVVRIAVTDWARAVRFYSETLGMPVASRSDEMGWAELETGEGRLALERTDESDSEGLVGRFVGVSLEVPDIETAHRVLAARGVEFVSPPEKQPWGGVLAHLRDPDGNILTLLGRR
jgi:predicted enzyme related to lactoylglutathione lyase